MATHTRHQYFAGLSRNTFLLGLAREPDTDGAIERELARSKDGAPGCLKTFP
jgi:hypothetical protein